MSWSLFILTFILGDYTTESRSVTKDYQYFGGGGGGGGGDEDSDDVWEDIIPPATGNSRHRDPSNTTVSC
jgi:hypothetical protein